MSLLYNIGYFLLSSLAITNGPEKQNTLTSTGGQLCTDLTGTWQNQLGSTMTIQRTDGINKNGDYYKITGRYNTTVESSNGAANVSSDMTGLVQPLKGGSLLAFNVIWNHGNSLTAWVGQCLVCDGQEKLLTTWVLRSYQTPQNRWMSNMIHQDTFHRIDQKDSVKNASVSNIYSDPVGHWKSATGDYIKITNVSETGEMDGLHMAPGSTNGAVLYGRIDGNRTRTVHAFAAVNAQYIKGWGGYIYEPRAKNQTMETAWLSHKFSEQCNDPRKHVAFGMDIYFKEDES
ncbi:uncharacterized protein LOC129971794 [Argiope bruennichi]|uniref:uncharacterized protein LOC129971794 n=1 Tax=Argiope bruennichi TaxID=94029 RepID=UPI0024947845|nr:uncharacterized protein LOC129971794 [Argiope bruennichi]